MKVPSQMMIGATCFLMRFGVSYCCLSCERVSPATRIEERSMLAISIMKELHGYGIEFSLDPLVEVRVAYISTI